MRSFMNEKKEFKTWDQWCLDKLAEIQPATQIEWAKAMGYENTFNMNSIIKKNRDILIISKRKNGRSILQYQIKGSKQQLECEHEFVSLGSKWFHWNTGDVMTIGRCLRCDLQKPIKASLIKKQKRLKWKRNW